MLFLFYNKKHHSMKKLVVLLIFPLISYAQQEPIVGMYWNHLSYFNAATAGIQYKHYGTLLYRDQWRKLSGSPRTLIAGYNTHIEQHGFGVNYLYEEIGLSKINIARLNYNYQFSLGEKKTLAIGSSLGFQNIRTDNTNFTPPTDPDINFNNSLCVNPGVAFISRRLSTGVSMTQIPVWNKNNTYRPDPHLFSYLMYKFDIGSNFKLIPAAFFSTDFNFYHLDLNLNLEWKEIVSLGAAIMGRDSFGANINWNIAKKFKIGYAYEITVSKLSNTIGSTHEINFCLGLGNRFK